MVLSWVSATTIDDAVDQWCKRLHYWEETSGSRLFYVLHYCYSMSWMFSLSR